MARPDNFDFAAEETPMTDDEIAEAVEQLFAADDRVDETYIEVTVENGVVRLEGSVSVQEEKEMAESLLDNIEGIQTVVNDLQVIESGYTPEPWPGPPPGEEEEFEDIEVLPADEDLVSEDPIETVEEGKSYVPPNEPMFPTERGDAAERIRERRAEEEATGEARDKL
ncbi:MAG: BON domain-containing protein [Actinobacteria bacterium]|nr:BON domain-containing protein [Actinomycetota bacterium]